MVACTFDMCIKITMYLLLTMLVFFIIILPFDTR